MSIEKYIFIDESGDPDFYGKRKKLLVGQEGYQPILIVGLIATNNKRLLRKKILDFCATILNDPLYKSIPSLQPPNWLPHARNDHPEVRAEFFKFIRNLEGFTTYSIIARKDINIFSNKHNSNPQEFYFDVLYHLLTIKLRKPSASYQIYLAHREKTNLPLFKKAIDRVLKEVSHEKIIKYDIVKSQYHPEMSIIDYLLWAIQRYIIKDDPRFFLALEEKYSFIQDLYDNSNENGNIYNKMNKFRIEKARNFNLKKT